MDEEKKQEGRTESQGWRAKLDDRARKHVAFAQHYADHFSHGAPGHLDLLTIAALANLLDEAGE